MATLPDVVVLGGGVSGLTSALMLLRAGFKHVTVWTDKFGMAPPNWVWEFPPYHVLPEQEVCSRRDFKHMHTPTSIDRQMNTMWQIFSMCTHNAIHALVDACIHLMLVEHLICTYLYRYILHLHAGLALGTDFL